MLLLTPDAWAFDHLQERSLSWNDKVNCKSAQLMREQNRRNAQLVPTYRDKPANEHRNSMVIPNYLY